MKTCEKCEIRDEIRYEKQKSEAYGIVEGVLFSLALNGFCHVVGWFK